MWLVLSVVSSYNQHEMTQLEQDLISTLYTETEPLPLLEAESMSSVYQYSAASVWLMLNKKVLQEQVHIYVYFVYYFYLTCRLKGLCLYLILL